MPTLFDHTNNSFNLGLTFANPLLAGPITVTQDGLISDNTNNALTLNGGVYTVTVNGGLISQHETGLRLNFVPAVSAISTVTVGATGVISGAQSGSVSGLFVTHGLTLINNGVIEGEYAVDIEGPGAVKITNSGVIMGGSAIYAPNTFTHSITNSGEMYGNVELGAAVDTLINSGLISGIIFMGGGADVVTNSGTITNDIALGSGNNKLTNTGEIWTHVISDGGNDIITNSGLIVGGVYLGEGNDILTNSGTIGDFIDLGLGNDKFTNSGDLNSHFYANSGNDALINSGRIEGDVLMDAGNDTFTNTGEVFGRILMGAGNDKFTGGKDSEVVEDEAGSDTYLLGAGDDYFDATGFGSATGVDTIDGGANGKINLANEYAGDYYRLDIADAASVNLDTLAHTAFGITIAAGRAVSVSGGTDILKNMESVQTGSGADTVFGSAGANYISTNDGRDKVNGFGGNDWISGGTGDDSLAGGLGRDTLQGGDGYDYFVFNSAAESTAAASGRDVIRDFDSTFDFIDLRPMGIVNGRFLGLDVAFDGVTNGARVITTSAGYLVQVDINHDKKVDMSIEVLNEDHTIDWVNLSNFFF